LTELRTIEGHDILTPTLIARLVNRGEMDQEEGERHRAVIEHRGPILARDRELGMVFVWRSSTEDRRYSA
jgi:hypothetical protein